jgi:hypothetical protein
VYGGLSAPAQGCAYGGEEVEEIGVEAQPGPQDVFPAIAMSRRVLQRRQFDQPLRQRLIDDAFARYLDWLAESEAVNAAYGLWSRTAGTDGALSFAAYGAALDREERAATVYGSVIEQLEQLFGGEDRLARAGQGAARA